MLLNDSEIKELAAALSVDAGETQLNSQGGVVVLDLPGVLVRGLANIRAKQEKLDTKAAQGLEYQMATAFLGSPRAANFALEHARPSVETPIVMHGDSKHAYVVSGEKPSQPSSYRIRLSIGRRPFA